MYNFWQADYVYFLLRLGGGICIFSTQAGRWNAKHNDLLLFFTCLLHRLPKPLQGENISRRKIDISLYYSPIFGLTFFTLNLQSKVSKFATKKIPHHKTAQNTSPKICVEIIHFIQKLHALCKNHTPFHVHSEQNHTGQTKLHQHRWWCW